MSVMYISCCQLCKGLTNARLLLLAASLPCCRTASSMELRFLQRTMCASV